MPPDRPTIRRAEADDLPATGADPSHAPARRAYEKAGFHVGIPSFGLCCDLAERAVRRGSS